MKIIITGGMGFIGAALARKLVTANHDVTLLDNLNVQIHGNLPEVSVPDDANFVRMDVRSLADRHELIEGADAVFHLAAETGVRR